VDSLKSHPHLEELFRSIFTFSQYDRIGLVKICEHPLLKVHFNKQFEFSSIAESQHEQSIFFTQLNLKSKWVNFLHKEEVILDFIERASESLALECHDVFEEDMRLKVHSAVLKMALIKCHNLIDLLYARIKPFFEVDVAEWEAFRKSAAGEEVRRKMERKEKLLTAAFKGAKAQFKSGNLLFDLSVPKSFNDIKKYSCLNVASTAPSSPSCTASAGTNSRSSARSSARGGAGWWRASSASSSSTW
jgi:hypothetical protein